MSLKRHILPLAASISFLIWLAGCASVQTTPRTRHAKTDDIQESLEQAAKEEGPLTESQRAAQIENSTIEEVIRIEEPNTHTLYDNSRYDFPITMNSRVEGWIDYFTGRGRSHMERYLGRSSRYIPMMKQTLKKAGLPEDLVYLALIESGFNLRAKSHARAVGAWQFIKATGKRYGLRVDAWIDERRDPIRSTEAAARYLKDLYLMFESWYLAASAYNAGEYKILRAIDKAKTNNFWSIAQTRLIRRETKDYVPKLIAAAIIAKNPAKYGFEDIAYQDPLEFEIVTVDFPIAIKEVAKLVDAPEEEIEDLNPELRRGVVPPGMGSYELRIPVGSRVLVERALTAIRTQVSDSEMPRQYTIRRGDTLRSVARQHRMSYKELANVNNLGPKERLSPGTKLILPGTSVGKGKVSEAVLQKVNAEGFVFHTVRSGESLWSISEKYDVTIQNIFRWNGLRKSKIMPGTKLKIKATSDPAEQAKESKASTRTRGRVS